MLRTKFTELVNIERPIVLAGMNWITTPELVAAVSNAGGLGLFATAHCSAEETRANIREIRTLTDKPFGVNQSLFVPNARENIQVALEEKVPVINYSLGKPWFIEQVHTYGGKVIGTVATSKHAARAEQMGVDAIIVTGFEAAAHGADATSMVLIPLVSNKTNLPIVAAGGLYDGRGLVAALSLGASAVSMGTRFMLTQESILHQHFKNLCIAATDQDTLYSIKFDGIRSRVLKTPKAEKILKGRQPFSVKDAIVGLLTIKKELGFSLTDIFHVSRRMSTEGARLSLINQARFAASVVASRMAIYDGDKVNGMLFAGLVAGAIEDIPSCKEVIDHIVDQAEAILTDMPKEVVTKE